MPYPGEVRGIRCPKCGSLVRLICKSDFKFHGTCSNCKKLIIEY